MNKLNGALDQRHQAVNAMGLDKPGGAQAGLTQLQAGRRPAGRRQPAGGRRGGPTRPADQGDRRRTRRGIGLPADDEGQRRRPVAWRGSTSRPRCWACAEFQKAAKAFISPDGHSVRYLVQTKLNPFSSEAMDQVNEISDVAKGAQPNTTLADATISMGGFPAALRDTRDYYQHDIRFIIVATLIVVLLTLMVLLRAIVAPLYLVGSVVISYFAAIGIGVLTFQFLLGQQLHWSVPPLAFVVLVAVGADYNMLLVSRMRDESPHSVRYGIIRTLSSTGGVITAAGLIFAASMGGLLVLQHRHRGPGRLRDRSRNPAGYLRGADHHGARHRRPGGAGELVAVASRRGAAA